MKITCSECRYSYPNNDGGLWCWERLNTNDHDSCNKAEKVRSVERIGGGNGKDLCIDKEAG